MTSAGDWSIKFLHYRFGDPALLERALTHRSAGGEHNERLEFLGDAVLGAVIAAALWERKPEADEGALSRYRASLVRRETLAGLARELGVGDWLRLGSGEARAGGHQRSSVLANALEALFGAIYLDGGFDAASGVILARFASRLDTLPPESALLDAKTALQERLQARGLEPPDYAVEAVSGAAHAQVFRASCRIPALAIETLGSGSSRRQAEQRAAEQALTSLPDDF